MFKKAINRKTFVILIILLHIISFLLLGVYGLFSDIIIKSVLIHSAEREVFVTAASGYYHTLGVTNSGRLYAWGQDVYGQLGDSAVVMSTTPKQVLALANEFIIQVAANEGASYALTIDGKVYSWGRGAFGRLGTGSISNTGTPTLVGGNIEGKKIVQISSAFGSVIALDEDGVVYTWGQNDYAQLGDGTKINRNTPVIVNLPEPIVQVTQGWWHTLAIGKSGALYGWGSNREGQLGQGTMIESLTPMLLKDDIKVIDAKAGGRHSLLITDNNEMYSTGYNTQGQVGINSITTQRTFVLNSYITDVVSIAAGYEHSAALTSDGSSYNWGYNTYGRLGLNDTTRRLIPTLNQNISDVSFICCCFESTLWVKKTDGMIYSSGYNGQGEIGDNTVVSKSIPTKAIFP